MSLFELYLISILDSVGSFFITVFVLSIIFSIVMLISSTDYRDKEDKQPLYSWAKRSASLGTLMLLLAVATPNTKQMMFILDGYMVTNTAGVEKLPENTVKAINTFLESMTEEEPKKETKE